MKVSAFVCVLTFMAALQSVAVAEDWNRFRGPAGQGVAAASEGIPDQWSAKANVAWKTAMPGPGASSPIVVGDTIFVTCYSGYGLNKEDPGDIKKLVRHLVSVDLKSGKINWTADVPVSLPEDHYTGIGVTAHGYASHTPVTDGKNVYAFFGKSGVHAFDMDGNKLWQADVGKESDPAKWGSSSSPVVFENLVIVTASAESQSIIAFDKASGDQVWKQEAKGLDNMWGTPTLISTKSGKTELVMCVAGEVWGMDPANGELLWFAKATEAQQSYSSVVVDGQRVFAMTGRGGGSIAIDAGGTGDVTDTNTVWEGRETASFGSPVADANRIYSVSGGVLKVLDKASGERLQQVRLRGAQSSGGRFGSLDYASPIIVGERLFYMNGGGQMFVFDLSEDVKQIAVNTLTADKETFWGTPAVAQGRMIIRSSGHLYCVLDKQETVEADPNLIAAAEPEQPEATGGRGGGRPGAGGGAGGGRRFDPTAMFNGLDTNKDGKLVEAELEGNRMADRLMTLDKDDDKAISSEEFRSGISSLFGSGGGGRGGRGGGGYERRGANSRPDRPQRPQMGTDSK